MINHYDLFAVRVTHVKLPIQYSLLKKITDYVDQNFEAKDGNYRSNVFGYQHHGDFDGKKELHETLDSFFAMNLNCYPDHGWLNALEGKAYNSPHNHIGGTHTASHKSAVYYLSENNNNITFVKDNQIQEFKPKLFDLLIFPSDLIHYVLPTENQDRRVSYAVNLKERQTQ